MDSPSWDIIKKYLSRQLQDPKQFRNYIVKNIRYTEF